LPGQQCGIRQKKQVPTVQKSLNGNIIIKPNFNSYFNQNGPGSLQNMLHNWQKKKLPGLETFIGIVYNAE